MHGKKAPRTLESSQIPLPPNYFRCPELPEKQVIEMEEIGEKSHADLIAKAQMVNGPMHWLPIYSSRGVSVFKANEIQVDENADKKKNPPKLECYGGVSQINASLAEIVDLFTADTTEQFKEKSKILLPDVIDCANLYSLRERTKDNMGKYFGVKWSAHNISVPLFNNMDYCYFEYQDYFEGPDKRKGWASCNKSIRIQSCPPLHESHDLMRGSYLESGFVFTESEIPGVLDVMVIVHLKAKGQLPGWIATQSIKHRFTSIPLIDNHLKRKRLNSQKFLQAKDLVPKNERKKCNICSRSFNLMSKKCQCRMCGEVVCVGCCKNWPVTLPVVGKIKVKICTGCSIAAQTIKSRKDIGNVVYSASVDCTGIDLEVVDNLTSLAVERQSFA